MICACDRQGLVSPSASSWHTVSSRRIYRFLSSNAVARFTNAHDTYSVATRQSERVVSSQLYHLNRKKLVTNPNKCSWGHHKANDTTEEPTRRSKGCDDEHTVLQEQGIIWCVHDACQATSDTNVGPQNDQGDDKIHLFRQQKEGSDG
eukprot:CAMPEP_0194055776 /NCGR_PEP_ID=MMETSP0009_2-20130614/57882_1 /TAXON_ID=210454 /ORGANISM="Grammatophora oceanica, Strain CCMP 410" /LENGTH=147 /DNA_ID=CAMNT_0038704827 /DNA_START=42 /DNA_END=485 /DNA_ORIENTATION=-